MAWLITVGLTALMVLTLVVMLIKRTGTKRIFKTLMGFVVVIGLFVIYANKTCGPNTKDIEIMTPQINAIAKHIVTNGVPNSLADIDNLDYDLKECKRNERYHNSYDELVKNKNEAIFLEIDEGCQFEAQGRMYEVEFYFVQYYRAVENTHGTLKIRNIITDTGILISFESHYGGGIVVDFEKYPAVYSVKTTGICNPMRQ